MNRYFANKTLLLKEQDSRVVLLFFSFALPLSALLPHAHFFAALWVVLFFFMGLWHTCGQSHFGALGKKELIFSLFWALTLSGAIFEQARSASILASILRLSFFLPRFFAEKKESICRFFAAVGGCIGIFAVAELLLGLGKLGYTDPRASGELARAAGPFGNPNLLAAFLLPCALFALGSVLYERRSRLLFLFFFLGNTAGIAASYSRGALLALFVSALLLLSVRIGWGRVLFAAFSLFPLLSLLLPESITSRLSSIFSPDSSVLYRFSLWRSVGRLPFRSLLFGVGEGKNAMLSLLFPVLSAGLLKIEHTHSVFLHILLAEGYLGLLLFLLLCVVCLIKRGSPERKAAFLSLLLFGIFDDPLYSGQTEVIFWLTMGLL